MLDIAKQLREIDQLLDQLALDVEDDRLSEARRRLFDLLRALDGGEA